MLISIINIKFSCHNFIIQLKILIFSININVFIFEKIEGNKNTLFGI